MTTLADLTVKLFTDGAEKAQILDMAKLPHIAGFTTNPSLLRKAGVTDYESYARDLVASVPNHSLSFEVISDDIAAMEAEARLIATWGDNVYVKLPVTTSSGQPLYDLVRKLSREGIKVNFTVICSDDQVTHAVEALRGGAPAYISVFAGRLADAGLDYMPTMRYAAGLARGTSNIEVIWASTREVWNVIEADRVGCHIITAPADILKKLANLGGTAADLSLQGIQAFVKDTAAAGLTLDTRRTAAA